MNSTYKCIIVDDEQDAIELLSARLSQLYTNIIVADAFTKWNDALFALRSNKYDILFIDISMPGKTGLEILKLLPGLESEIIFVTAHDEFALNAFSFAATGYILKPIDDVELSAAIAKCLERINHKNIANLGTAAESKLASKIGLRNSHGVDYVNVNDILYLESVNKCTTIITIHNRYTNATNIGAFKNLLEYDQFFQVHRSFIVNLNFIFRYVSSGLVIMQDKKEIPVSRNIRPEFLKIFENR